MSIRYRARLLVPTPVASVAECHAASAARVGAEVRGYSCGAAKQDATALDGLATYSCLVVASASSMECDGRFSTKGLSISEVL